MKSYLPRKQKLSLILVLIIALLTATGVFAAANSWQNVGLAGFSAGLARYTSLAFDNSNTPYVAYRDVVNSDKATVMKYENGNWTTIGLPGFSAKAASYISLAFDNNSIPYVAYKDYNESDSASTVMRYNGTSWETVGSAGFSAGKADYTSLAMDSSSGTPYVAYKDYNELDDAATVMKYENGNWTIVGSAGFSYGKVDFTSLALDSSGTPYVAYRDAANSYKATVMRYNDVSWETVGSAGFSDGHADHISLALDIISGTPYVAYQDVVNGSRATVMEYTGNTTTDIDATPNDGWEYVGSADFSAGQVDCTSLALDSSGTPYVAYLDVVNSDKATVMKYTGIGLTGWETVGSTGFSDGQADYTSLALDSNGKPYVAYQDVVNGSRATVKAYLPSPTVSTSSPASGATIQSTSTLTVDFNEDMLHDGTANAADNAANYILVEEGNVGSFQTTTCAIGAVVGDTEIAILSAAYSNNGGGGPYRATLGVAPLENGSYQLLACGSATIHNTSGAVLNDGTDSVISFTVVEPAQPAQPEQPKALPATGFAPGMVTQLPKQGLLDAYQQYNYVSLEIPSLEVEAPIVGVPVSQDRWNLSWLDDQAGWLHGTAFPSWAGNSAITAHVYDANGQPGLFNSLGELKWGDEVLVHAYGQAYVYEVRSVEKYVQPDDTSSVFKHENYPWLTLITCKGYDEDSDSYRWRVAVRAVQVDVR
jgi:LPXTG-site transpeptidase (sortase) family protein